MKTRMYYFPGNLGRARVPVVYKVSVYDRTGYLFGSLDRWGGEGEDMGAPVCGLGRMGEEGERTVMYTCARMLCTHV